jgi:hypothetical protein
MAKIPATSGRVVIEAESPQVDGGRFAAKRVVGEPVTIEADVFGDGHDAIGSMLRHREAGARRWVETRMTDMGNDRWRAEFIPDTLGVWQFEVEGWQDHFATWIDWLEKKVAAEVDVSMDLLIGKDLVAEASARARGKTSRLLKKHATTLGDRSLELTERLEEAFSEELRTAILHLVRVVPSVVVTGPCSAWNLGRRHQAAVLCRRHGLRRALPAADPSHRDHVPQGPQQQARC